MLAHVTRQSGQGAAPGYTYEVAGQWEQTPGDVSVMLYLADAAELGADGAIELAVRSPFHRYCTDTKDMEPTSCADTTERYGRHSIVGNTVLPDGQADGEPLCIVLDARARKEKEEGGGS